MTSHHDIYTTTDVKPEMIPGIQTGNGIPNDKCNLRGISHARSNKKDDIFKQWRLYIDKAHTALDILRFAVFLEWNSILEIHTEQGKMSRMNISH